MVLWYCTAILVNMVFMCVMISNFTHTVSFREKAAFVLKIMCNENCFLWDSNLLQCCSESNNRSFAWMLKWLNLTWRPGFQYDFSHEDDSGQCYNWRLQNIPKWKKKLSLRKFVIGIDSKSMYSPAYGIIMRAVNTQQLLPPWDLPALQTEWRIVQEKCPCNKRPCHCAYMWGVELTLDNHPPTLLIINL